MKRTAVIDIISAILLLLLLYTAISKFIEYRSFKEVLSVSPLLKPFAGFIAWALPFLELVIVILLFIPALRIKGLYASLLLLIILTAYPIYMILFTPNLPCSCGGVLKDLTWPQHVLFNLFFVILSGTGIILARRRFIMRIRGEAPT